MAQKATKEYTFDFINGWKPSGKPIIIKRKVRANTIAEAEKSLKKRYPRASMVSLKGRIKTL